MQANENDPWVVSCLPLGSRWRLPPSDDVFTIRGLFDDYALCTFDDGGSMHCPFSVLRARAQVVSTVGCDGVDPAALKASAPVWDEAAMLRAEFKRLRAIEAAARTYYQGYVRDEAEDAEACINEGQHEHAKTLRDALNAVHEFVANERT